MVQPNGAKPLDIWRPNGREFVLLGGDSPENEAVPMRKLLIVSLIAALALLAVACGDGDEPSPPAPPSAPVATPTQPAASAPAPAPGRPDGDAAPGAISHGSRCASTTTAGYPDNRSSVGGRDPDGDVRDGADPRGRGNSRAILLNGIVTRGRADRDVGHRRGGRRDGLRRRGDS